MNIPILTLLLLLFVDLSFAQNLRYEIQSPQSQGVSKEKLSTAKTFFDIRQGYALPIQESFTSSQLTVTSKGVVTKASGKTEYLNEEQKRLLLEADLDSHIGIEMGFIFQNQVTLFPEIHELAYKVAVVLDGDAMYEGGNDELKRYLDKTVMSKVKGKFENSSRNIVLKFTVSETGNILNVVLVQSSDDTEVDAAIVKALRNMPQWKPAKNAEGVTVKQDFEFTMGNGC